MSEREQGCLNAHCHLRLGPPPRQHTNGPCNCLRDIPTPKRIEIGRKLAALRAEVERLEAAKLRLREVVKSVEHSERVNPLNGERYKACPSCWQAEPQHFTDCQLAAVLRETDVENETGRE